MTREDKRAYNYARDRLANDDYPVYSDEYELKLAYKAGIEDAKNHPRWISVEDEFPIDYEPVLAVVGGNHFAFVGICLNKKTWYCEIQNKATEIIGITHWCHLPQPPILSNSSNIGKDLKGGEE